MNKAKLFMYSIVAALAGFIFGFDTVVISGANLPIKELWHTTPLFHGFFIMSAALWGTVIGALFAGGPIEKYGRKNVLLAIGIVYTASAFGSAFAQDPYTFSIFRILGGLGIGVSSVVAPTYISEISTAQMRGRLVAMYQFNIVFGILIAFLSNYFLQGFDGANDWRWMLGVLAIPSVLYTVFVMAVPESPRWLISARDDIDGAREVLKTLGVENIDQSIKEIQEGGKHVAGSNDSILKPKYRRILMLAFWVAFFNQLSGINFILYYAPELLVRAGVATKDSLFQSISIGGINLLFTFVGLYLIDRVGRKTLLAIGSFGYIISLAAVAWCFYAAASPSILLFFILLFIAAHAIGQGAVIWVFISEVFPNSVRAVGQGFGASVHWVFAALITLITPVFLDEGDGLLRDKPYIIFVFFTIMMVLQLIWVLTKVPETKGVSLEDLEKKLVDKE